MPESVSISVNGQSRVPPGFRFHPTEEELLQYYLRKKVASEKIDLDVIVEVDLNKLEPWDIQEKCRIGSTPQNDWYFFSHKDKKYPTGTRTNRATMAGFWKATGRDKIIYGNGARIGMRKTLVFYKGRAPHGLKSDWIMHEYRLDDNGTTPTMIGEAGQEEGWVVCRIFKKKHLVKSQVRGSNTPLPTPSALSPSYSSDVGSLEKIFQQHEATQNDVVFTHNNNKLPGLESPMTNPTLICDGNYDFAIDKETPSSGGRSDWAAMDRMLAAHLNGQQHPPPPPPTIILSEYDHKESVLGLERSSSLNSLSSQGVCLGMGAHDYYSSTTGEVDLWSLISRSSLSSSTASDHLM